jgi:hypothetical protein
MTTATFITFNVQDKIVYFRIRVYGLCIGARSRHVPLFSERMGYKKLLYIGPIVIEVLKP